MIIVNRTDLLKPLEPLKALLKKQSDMDEGSGQITYSGLRFWCRSGDYWLSTVAPTELEELKEFSVSGDLLTFLGKTNADEITLDLEDSLLVKAQRSRPKFSLLKPYSFEYPSEFSSITDAPTFISTFSTVSKVTSRSFARPALTAVHVSDKQMEASDEFRFLRVSGDQSFITADLLIPALAFTFISNLEPTEYYVDDNQLFLRNADGTVGSCPLIGGTFPDITKNMNAKGHNVQVSKNIYSALDRCLVFTSRSRFEEERVLSCTLVNGRIKMTADSPSGDISEVVKANYPEGIEGRKFAVNPDFFKEALTHSLSFLLAKSSIHVETEKSYYICLLKG